ncbi:MAG: VCBS repeat-containing protein [Bacteroidetes bacterium]|nr:VCBS repeat-containing protein [Bacteroidota bacterium]
MRHSYTLLFLALTFSAQAQISFTNQTSLLTNPDGFTSGIAVAIADMNGDGLDDIVRLNNGTTLSIEYQSVPGQPFANYTYGTVPGDAWAMAVGDVNNDGYCDIFAGGYYDKVKVLTATVNGSNYQVQNMPGADIFVQGANFADINNDGWLDVFSCHDDGAARIWANDGSGGFATADNWINLATVPASDNSGNYGSVWTDFDNDRDLDLYIAKCRQGVDNPEDPRRINALFVNDGQSNYSEQADKYGLKIKWQSWTADFQDIDNDGDMDCLVTNHDHNLQLLLNDGAGHFTDISTQAGMAVSGGFLQGIMRDLDNDGFVDIITADPTHVFHNNGNLTFTEIGNPFGNTDLGTLAAGDLNHDGFQDIYAAYACGISNPCNIPDKLWMNNANNDNHFVAFNLHGTVSNRMGVGARVEIHGAWGIQVREVRAGESYGIQNSLTQFFGLGGETEVDYVVVRWPSGTVDVVKNPTADAFHTIVEGSTCTLSGFDLQTSGPAVICPGQSVEISAPAGYDYLWSNGFVSQTLSVSAAGNYSVVAVDAQGCVAVSNVLAVTVNPDETPSLTLDGEAEICEGNSVTLTSSTANGYTWSNGETTPSINVTQTGDYFVTIPGACGNFTSETIHIEVLLAPAPVAANVYIPAAGSATLEATGTNLVWYDSPVATVPLGTGAVFATPVVTQVDTFYVEDVHQFGGGEFATGMPEQQGSNLYNGANFNGQTIFEVYQPLTLTQVTLNTDQPGVRLIELKTEAGAVVASQGVDLPVGETIADLNFYIVPGYYRLVTNTANNLAVLGTNSPRLYRSNEDVTYPYTVPDAISITGSDLGSGFYYYFFDWQIEVEPTECVSERVPVIVTVGVNSTGEALPFGSLSVQPNPSSGLFMLDLEPVESGVAMLTVLDLAGRVVSAEKFEAAANVRQQRPMDLTNVPSGMYFLKITCGARSGWVKLVVE